jgi:hypothetical protein
MAKLREVSPWTVWLIAAPGRTETGEEFKQRIATQGRKVWFLCWPGGMTVAVTFPASQSAPSIHQIMHAYRMSVDPPRGAGSA